MSATTYAHMHSDGPLAGIRRASSRVFNRMVESRMREAERRVAYHLLSLDDRTLADLGYDRATLSRQGTIQRGL